MSKTSYEYHYTVLPEEIDELDHVNNIVYLQWVQEAANRHWTALTENKNFDDYVWVIGRHEIDYFRPALLHDQLIIKTWVGKTEGSSSIRHVEIFKNNKIITRTLTTWRLLNAKTFRPTPIPDELLQIMGLK